jgi:hypothetical protein
LRVSPPVSVFSDVGGGLFTAGAALCLDIGA